MLHVITGGSGSGKSAFAEDCIVKLNGKERIYIATMYPFDEESHQRIKKHQKMRSEKGFQTIECYVGIKNLAILNGADVLLECMSNLTANEMYRSDGAGIKTVEEILEGVNVILQKAANLLIVTNEVFSDGITYDEETKRYQEYLGIINKEVGRRADLVTEVVCGIPITQKRGKECERV